jgi:hypothetical protein
MPENERYAMESNPVSIIVIPKPFKPSGTFEYFNLNRIADIITIAMANPTPELTPNTVDSAKLYPRSFIKSEEPKIAQFTAIKGKNIPKELCRDGLNLSNNISTSCTDAAIVAINVINVRKLKLTVSIPGIPVHVNAPFSSKYAFINQFRGTVIPFTKITAMPRPIDVSTFLEIAKKEHIPKK